MAIVYPNAADYVADWINWSQNLGYKARAEQRAIERHQAAMQDRAARRSAIAKALDQEKAAQALQQDAFGRVTEQTFQDMKGEPYTRANPAFEAWNDPEDPPVDVMPNPTEKYQPTNMDMWRASNLLAAAQGSKQPSASALIRALGGGSADEGPIPPWDSGKGLPFSGKQDEAYMSKAHDLAQSSMAQALADRDMVASQENAYDELIKPVLSRNLLEGAVKAGRQLGEHPGNVFKEMLQYMKGGQMNPVLLRNTGQEKESSLSFMPEWTGLGQPTPMATPMPATAQQLAEMYTQIYKARSGDQRHGTL